MQRVGRVRAAARELAIASVMALAGAVILDRTGAQGSEFFVGVLFGLGVGLGVFSFAAWRRECAC